VTVLANPQAQAPSQSSILAPVAGSAAQKKSEPTTGPTSQPASALSHAGVPNPRVPREKEKEKGGEQGGGANT